jgi:hypothetical protein
MPTAVSTDRTLNQTPGDHLVVPASLPSDKLQGRDLVERHYWFADGIGAQDLRWRVDGTRAGAPLPVGEGAVDGDGGCEDLFGEGVLFVRRFIEFDAGACGIYSNRIRRIPGFSMPSQTTPVSISSEPDIDCPRRSGGCRGSVSCVVATGRRRSRRWRWGLRGSCR